MSKSRSSKRSKSIKRKTKRNNKMKRVMNGGATYTNTEKTQLRETGFSDSFIKLLEPTTGFNVLLADFQNSGKTAEQYMRDMYNELNINPDDGFTTDESQSSQDSQYSQGGKRRNKGTRTRTRTRKNNKKSRKHNKRIRKGAF